MKNYIMRPLSDNVDEMFIGPFGSSLKNDCFVKKDSGYCMVYEQKHAIQKTMDVETRYVTEEKYNELKRFNICGGDIIVSCRGTIGETFIVPDDAPLGIMHPSIMKIRLKKDVYDKSYFNLLLQKWLRKHETGANGSGVKMAISAKKLGAELFPVPPIEEQHKISDIILKVHQIINERTQQLQKLDELVKARFVELFGDPISNPMKWDIYRLEECLERIDNGKSFICSDKPRTGDNPAILKLSAATYGDYRPNENKALLDESLFIESSEVHAGDLLFTRKNTPELVGMAAYVQNTPPKLMMPDLIFRLVPNEKVNAVFLWQLINCKEFRPVIQAISGGSAKSMSNISKERLGKIKVICPPRELQDSLISFVEQIDKSKVAVQKALDEAQLLFDSLMQKYFG